ncbi:hypothetical protein M569_13079, partial [Genlisea aurea]
DDLTSFYAPPIHHPYYHPNPPADAHTPPTSLLQPIHAHQPHILAFATHSSQDHVRTLFVAGLPEDVKPREIYNLFREFPGYMSSNLRPPGSSNSQPFAFATFSDQPSAILAMHSLNGLVFDLETGSTLYINLAKSNSRSKRSRTDDDNQDSEKRFKGESASFSRGFGSGKSYFTHITGLGSSVHNTIGYPSPQRYETFDGSVHVSGSNSKSGGPCPTLFVANLGPMCSEEELMQVFSRCRGFLKLKLQSTYGAPVAFVDFKDSGCSSEALRNLQGVVVYSATTHQGLRLEYAKSRMGLRSKRSR